MRRAACVAVLLAASAAACGKEGPPLPPLRPEPGHVREVTAIRDGDRIELRVQIPPANFDGTTPPVMERVEVYRMETAAGAPAPGATDLLNSKHLVGVIPVRAPDEKSAAQANAPGAVAGASTVYADAIDRSAAKATAAATRYYLVVGATGRSRRGRPSPILPVPLAGDPAPPAAIKLTYDQEAMTLAWTGQASQQFRVYEASGPGAGATATELTKTPIAEAQFVLPIWFGTTRCFAIRAIETTERVSVVGPIGPGVCETPVDTFPPPAPEGLFATQEEPGIVLRWSASKAPDLAGYRVLRGEGTGETLQQLLKAPITELTYVDAAITPGVTYTYVVIAVDRAGNVSGQSNRQQVTARRPATPEYRDSGSIGVSAVGLPAIGVSAIGLPAIGLRAVGVSAGDSARRALNASSVPN